ncbi:MAG: hypothetical protein JSS43_13670, partial [Proteobacteria bacterium]|nr:hypothetical protein [Pseudomonadota bacterium]
MPCTGGDLPKQDLTLSAALDNAVRQGKDSQPDLLVTGTCIVKAATPYYFGNVNIIKPGILVFQEADATAAPADKVTSFWAKSIIIENGGTVLAGTGTYKDTGGTDVTLKAFGSNGGRLDIVLYGEDQSPPAGTNPGPPGVSAPCASPATDGAGNALGPCGIPATTWNDNGNSILTLGNGVQDRFYQYGPLFLDGKIDSGKTGYFGYKSIGLSYGGTLLMRGLKGTSLADDTKRDQSGSSWVRLAADAGGESGKQTSILTLDRKVVPDSGTDWQVGDEVVVTTTDFLATHSEKVTIKTIVAPTQIEVTPALQFPHVGHRYDLATHFQNASDTFKTAMKASDVDPDDPTATNPSLLQSAETRAAVALLNRSIRIMSGGDRAGETLDDATNGNTQKGVTGNASYQFGGHMIFRQGFQKLQMQGVELRQLGVGGRLAHYPAHFHMARKTPPDTFIKDSAVNESMTRWFVLHSTLGVTLQRNVGWMSIGHGYFLEDGTETDNRLFGNIGIFARPAIIAPFNPRNIPGILAHNKGGSDVMFRSDVANPTIFWITNGYNDFAGNLAVGAGACGACFWLHAVAANTDMVDVPTGGDGMQHQKWDIPGVRHSDRPGMFSPLRSFFRNSCSTAMLSFMTVSNYQDCTMVADPATKADDFKMTPVTSYAPEPGTDVANKLMYYPLLGGQRIASDCPGDQPDCVADVCNSLGAWCATTVLDHYTSSFNYAEINFSAIWLRAQGWFLYDHSFLSDVLGGGLSAVSGGDYSRTSSPSGYWNMASHSVFVGATQPQKGDSSGTYNPYADTRGPHVPADKATGSSNLACKLDKAATMCISAADGLGFFLENFNVGQRMFNIYDGPAYEDGNAYVNIRTAACPEANADGTVDCMYGKVIGVRKYTDSDTNASPPRQKGDAYLANAAIGWKQPNGFYYPPAFHSSNLFFSGVDIRHYVISPLFIRGKYQNDGTAQHEQYATDAASIFGGFTDIDRQTVLNDDDGSLTGFKGTLSINDDPFYAAPVQVAECGSNPGIGPANACLSTELKRPAPPGARSSPYEYVTTVIYPECGAKPPAGDGAGSGACGSVVVPPPGFTEDPAAVKSTRHLTQDGRGGDWSKSCDGPHCFGVPIYRQNLTNSSASGTGTPAREWEKWTSYGCVANPADPRCDFPFIR